MLRITVTIPSSLAHMARVTHYRVQDSVMRVCYPADPLPGFDETTDVTIDVEESRLPALACSLGPTFVMRSTLVYVVEAT